MKKELKQRIKNASVKLNRDSKQSGKNRNSGEAVQLSWGSAMRR